MLLYLSGLKCKKHLTKSVIEFWYTFVIFKWAPDFPRNFKLVKVEDERKL